MLATESRLKQSTGHQLMQIWNFQQGKNWWDFCLELIESPGFEFWPRFCFGRCSMQLHIQVWVRYIHIYVDTLSWTNEVKHCCNKLVFVPRVYCHQAVNSMLTFLIIILKYQLQAFILGICLFLCMEYLAVDVLALISPDHFTLDALHQK